MTDSELLELLQGEPEKGLSRLMDKYTGLVYTIVYNKLQQTCSREDIEECVSNIFFSFYRSIHKVDLDKGSIKAFLSVIAKRRSIEVFRSLINMNSTVPMDDKLENIMIDMSLDVEKKVTDQETRHDLMKVVNSLGKPDSEIILRKYFYGQSSKEIADCFGLKENTVNKKISRCLIKMKKHINIHNQFQEVF